MGRIVTSGGRTFVSSCELGRGTGNGNLDRRDAPRRTTGILNSRLRGAEHGSRGPFRSVWLAVRTVTGSRPWVGSTPFCETVWGGRGSQHSDIGIHAWVEGRSDT